MNKWVRGQQGLCIGPAPCAEASVPDHVGEDNAVNNGGEKAAWACE